MDPVSGLIVLSVVSAGGKAIAQNMAADSKMEALDLAREQHVLQHQQKTLANFETTQKLLDRNIAEATTRGVGLGSQSLEAIQTNILNTSAKTQKNLDIEESIFDRNVSIEKQKVNDTLFSELFGDAASLSTDFYSAQSKMPTTG